MERTLNPEEAEQIVDQQIEEFGLSALPRVKVTPDAKGQWQIAWDEHRRVAAPMTAGRWRAWLEEHVGTLDPERLETLEG